MKIKIIGSDLKIGREGTNLSFAVGGGVQKFLSLNFASCSTKR